MSESKRTSGDVRSGFPDPNRGKATLSGETVEPRILLSATWDYVHQGTNGDDTMNGAAGDGLLLGGRGNDVLRGSAGDDELRGDGGIDTLDFSAASRSVAINLGSDSAIGAFGNDVLSGIENVITGAFADRVTDDDGDSLIQTGAGDDQIWTYGGNDVIDGGAGHDVVHFTTDVAVDFDATLTTEQSVGALGRKAFRDIEGFVGSWSNDVFRFSAPASGSSFVIDGDSGEDHIDLTGWSSASALFDANSVVVDLGSGRSFRIDFTNVELVQFADLSMPFGGVGIQPVAEAGPDQTVTEGSVVTLDASQTTAGGGGASRYTWIQISGPLVALVDEHAERPTFIAPNVLTDAVIEFKLVVSDGDSVSNDAVRITVRGDDDAPLADAGADQAAAAGQVVQLDAGLSADPEGQPVNYTWVQVGGPPVTLSDPHAARPTFTAPRGVDPSSVQFTVQVSDGTSVSADLVTVTIAPTPTFGHWTFDEGTTQSVQNVYDVSGNDRNGFLGRQVTPGTVDAVRVVDPLQGRALEFAGEQLVGSLGNGPSGDFAVAAWFRCDSGTSQQTIYSTDNGREIWLGIHAGSGRVEMSVGGVNDYIKTGNGVVVGGQWQHVTATWDGTVGRIFIDGVEQATAVAGSPHAPIASGATIGARDDGSEMSREWRGRIDDVRVFDHAVSAADAARMAGDVAPIADAGVDRSVDPDDVVTLDASGSSDPNGMPLSYRWIQTEGPVVTLADPNAAKPTFTAPRLEHAVAYKFDVVVSDGFTCRVDSVVVTVNADTTDDPPVARAGDDQTVVEGVRVWLDGTGSSDPEGQTLTYAWTQVSGPAVTLSDPTAARPEFTAPELSGAADIQFKLTVSDGVHQTTDVVTIRVGADDDAPVASAGDDQSVVEGDVVRLDGTASVDPEGRDLTYQWTQIRGPRVELSDPNSATPEFKVPDVVGAETIEFQLTVSDGEHRSTDVVTIRVDGDDDAPMVDAGPDLQVRNGAEVKLHAVGQDPEGRALTYTWQQIGGPEVELGDATSANPTFRAPDVAARATLQFVVAASDGTTTTYDTVAVVVTPAVAPEVVIRPAPNAGVGDFVVVQAEVKGATESAEPVTYTWTQVSGPQVQLVATDQPQLMFLAPSLARGGEMLFRLTVTSGSQSTTQVVSVFVDPDPRAAQPIGRAAAAPVAVPTAFAAPATSAAAAPVGGVVAAPATPAATGSAGGAAAAASGTGTPAAAPTAATAATAADAAAMAAADDLLAGASGFDAERGAAGSSAMAAPAGPTGVLAPSAAMAAQTEAVNDAAAVERRQFRLMSADQTVRADAFADDDRPDANLLADTASAGSSSDGKTRVLAPDLVVAESGNAVALKPRLPGGAGELQNVRWTQTSGMPLELAEPEGGVLHVRLPEVFVEEELVFQVEVVQGDRRLLQEVAVQVQPVGMTNRALSIDDQGVALARADGGATDDGAGRGIGKVWGAMLAFLGAQTGRRGRDA
jgi:hypothetical protein